MAEYITAACGYRNALSSRKLSKIIGRDRASVTSTVDIDDQGKRTQYNQALHFWGENDSKSCSSNYVFHNTCVKYIIEYYQTKYNNRFTKVAIFSDGCAEQYKSSHAAFEMTFLLKELKITEILHTYAPTAQFKCCCDSAGSDTKSYIRKAEIAGNIRANSAWEVCMYLHEHMPKPDVLLNQLSQFQINERRNLYVIRHQDLTAQMKDCMLTAGHNIVPLRESVGEKKGQTINNIRKVYQIRASNDMVPHTVMHRNIVCACSECLISNYHACLTNSTWTTKLLRKEAAEDRFSSSRARIIEARDQNNATAEEERSGRLITDDVESRLQAKRVRESRVGQQRDLSVILSPEAISSQKLSQAKKPRV